MHKTIGIDLGDTFFRIAYLDGITPRLVADTQGRTAFPSKVSFLQKGGYHAGFDAEMFGIPENTILHPVTLAGATWDELQQLNETGIYPYQFFMESGHVFVDAHRVFPSIKDALVALFSHAKKLAEDYLEGDRLSGAVIAIPPGSNDRKRIFIQRAAEEAGLTVRQLLNQTTAAALGYRFDQGENRTIAVIDVGASHTSLSILRGGGDTLEVVETRHSPWGTDALQAILMLEVNNTCIHETGISLLGNWALQQELKKEVEFALIDLSAKETAILSFGGVGPGGSRIVLDVSTQQFDRAIQKSLDGIRETIVSPWINRVDVLLLIGGGANIPSVQKTVEMVYRKAPFSSDRINPSDVVALGAAIKGGILDGIVHSQITERTVHDLGTFHGRDLMDVLIPRGTPLPHQSSREYSFRGEPPIEYFEKVYQWTGNASGQDKPETHRNMIVLARKQFRLSGGKVRVTFTIDESGIAKFEVTDLATNNKFPAITGFEIH